MGQRSADWDLYAKKYREHQCNSDTRAQAKDEYKLAATQVGQTCFSFEQYPYETADYGACNNEDSEMSVQG
ncbi:MAG: hypothetical protein WAL15_25040, partial [Xanthobacteraceae bacterium]